MSIKCDIIFSIWLPVLNPVFIEAYHNRLFQVVEIAKAFVGNFDKNLPGDGTDFVKAHNGGFPELDDKLLDQEYKSSIAERAQQFSPLMISNSVHNFFLKPVITVLCIMNKNYFVIEYIKIA